MMNERLRILMKGCGAAHISGYTISHIGQGVYRSSESVWTPMGNHLDPLDALLFGNLVEFSYETSILNLLEIKDHCCLHYPFYFKKAFSIRANKARGIPNYFPSGKDAIWDEAFIDATSLYYLLKRDGLFENNLYESLKEEK